MVADQDQVGSVGKARRLNFGSNAANLPIDLPDGLDHLRRVGAVVVPDAIDRAEVEGQK